MRGVAGAVVPAAQAVVPAPLIAAKPHVTTMQVRHCSSGKVHSYVDGTVTVCRAFKCGTPTTPSSRALFSDRPDQWSALDGWCLMCTICAGATGSDARAPLVSESLAV